MRKIVTAMSALFLFSSLSFAGDDKEDLGKASKKATEMKSYTFKATIEVDGSPMPMDPIELNGTHNNDAATHVSGSIMGQDFEAYKKGEKLVTKGQDGEWTSGGGGGRGMGGGMMARAIKTPHEELKDLETKFKEIKKADAKELVGETDCTVYSGDLTDEAAKDMMPMGRGMGGMGNAEITGKGKVWVNPDGVIVKYQFDIALSLDFQGNALEITVLRTTELSKIDDTKVEVPEEVQKLFTD